MKKIIALAAALAIIMPLSQTVSYSHICAEEIQATADYVTENGLIYKIADDSAELASSDTDLTEIIIPSEVSGKPVTAIGYNVFLGNKNIVSVELPQTVRKIDGGAFEGCSELSEISMPDSLEYIGDGSFRDCSSLESFSMPDSVTETGGGVFSGCTSLKKVKLSENIVQIPFLRKGGQSSFEFAEVGYYGYFSGCTQLEEVSIPDGVTEIPYMTFSGCSSLKNIYTGDSVETLGVYSFSDCTLL